MAPAALRYRHLAELAIGYLDAAGQPHTATDLAAYVLGESLARRPQFVALLAAALAEDERFRRDGAGNWGLAGWSPAEPPLAEQEFVVIDVETTGGRSERHRIVEVGAVRLRLGQVAEQYAALVNPQQPVPRFVTELTGITPDMLETARPAGDVLAEFRAFAADAVLVGHNVACDLSFLNYEALWHGLPPFGNRALDTEELAVRLLPGVRRPSLGRVATALGLAQPRRHRALADARLAAEVLLGLLPRLEALGVTTFAELQEWLASRLAARQERVRRVRAVLPAGTLRSLPERPGVYAFKDAAGQVLYVGKAASLRDRVAQHFTGTALAARHHDGLLDRTAAVEHALAGCELEALLLESEWIRRLRPLYNVQERSRRGCPFVRLEREAFPRVAAATQVMDDGAFYGGPYRTTQAVRHTIQTVRRVFQLRSCRRRLPARQAAMRVPCLRLGQGLCPAPCADRVTAEQYATLVRYARLFVVEGKAAALEALATRLAELDRCGGRESWEWTALAECRSRLARVRREYRPLQGGLAGGAVVMAYATAEGGVTLFFVQNGRLTGRAHLPAGQTWPAAVAAAIGPHFHAPPDDAALDVDQANLLLRWVYRHTGRPELIPAGPGVPALEIAEQIACLASAATGRVEEAPADLAGLAEAAGE